MVERAGVGGDRNATAEGLATIRLCGDCHMIVCADHKRIAWQCGCTNANKRRVDGPCPRPPNCWGPSTSDVHAFPPGARCQLPVPHRPHRHEVNWGDLVGGYWCDGDGGGSGPDSG